MEELLIAFPVGNPQSLIEKQIFVVIQPLALRDEKNSAAADLILSRSSVAELSPLAAAELANGLGWRVRRVVGAPPDGCRKTSRGWHFLASESV